MAQNEMRAMRGLPQSVRLSEWLGGTEVDLDDLGEAFSRDRRFQGGEDVAKALFISNFIGGAGGISFKAHREGSAKPYSHHRYSIPDSGGDYWRSLFRLDEDGVENNRAPVF